MVKELQQLFSKSEVMIFTDYRGLTVSDITNLRRQLREKGVEYHVTKNTLTTLAAHRAGVENVDAMLDGPTAIAFLGDDIPGAAKVLSDFVRTSRILQIRGGLAGRTVLNADQVGDLTKVLTREQYIAQVLGSMQSPISNFVGVLNATLRGFMNVMQARMDQLKEQGDTSGAAAGSPDTTVQMSDAEAGPAADTTPGEVVVETPDVDNTRPEQSAAAADAGDQTPAAVAGETNTQPEPPAGMDAAPETTTTDDATPTEA